MESLINIARRSGANKKYLRIFVERYELLFSQFRYAPLTILEIGIGGYDNPIKGGGSLRMWSEFFPNATIVGLDCYAKKLQLPRNVIVECGSQADTELLNKLSNDYGGFDIIIDDASHITEKTIKTFEALWPHTRHLYIVEDLHMVKAKGTKDYFQGFPSADFNTLNMCVIAK